MMGPVPPDCNGISAEEGSVDKQSSALVSLHRTNDIPLVKSQAADQNQVEASQVPEAQLLSSCGSIKEATPRESPLSHLPDANDNEEEVDIPRVGDKYQVEIPSLLSDSEQYRSTVKFKKLVGLPMPVVWMQLKESNTKDGRTICIDQDDAKMPARFRRKKKSQLGRNKRDSGLNKNLIDVHPHHRKYSEFAKPGFKVEANAEMHKMDMSKSRFLVPEIQYGSWNDADENGFLLGLYIFGKNFVQIKRFMENKDMGDILSFYYGKFCKSKRHHRWSDCIKRRNTKNAWGQKLFSGWRHQELLSRLLSQDKEEKRKKLLEVSKLFTKKEISLEEYAFSLKDIFGLLNLAKAVGAGAKGKENLTGVAMAPVCPRVPVGIACSSLTPDDIIKYLTSGFGLNKTQKKDIFWEAVWPRLLARGWQSEQVKNHRSNDCFIFMKPGIMVIERKNLVKDKDFFDSPSDVLRKVASEPHLIDLEAEKTRYGSLKEVINCPPAKTGKRKVPDHRGHSLLNLQDKMLNMMFTIVDTSSIRKGKTYKLRKLSEVLAYSESNSRLSCPEKEGKGNSLHSLVDAHGMDMDTVEEQSNCEKNVHSLKQYKDTQVVMQCQAGYNVTSDGNMHVEDINREGVSALAALKADNAPTSMDDSLESKSTMPDIKQPKSTIKLHFKKRARCEQSSSLALEKSENPASSALVKEIQDTKNESERLESEQMEPHCKQYSSPNAFGCPAKELSTGFCTKALMTDTAAGTTNHRPNKVSKRRTTRYRKLTAKAHEALASNEIYNVWKRKIRVETKNNEDDSFRAPKRATKIFFLGGNYFRGGNMK